MLSLPDHLLSGGTEAEWVRLVAASGESGALPSVVDEEGLAVAEDQADDGEILVHRPADEEDRDSDDDDDDEDDSDDSDSDSDSSAEESAGASASGKAAGASEAPSSALLEDDELLRADGSSGAPGEDLVEFEIVIDGEVQGTTFLPRQGANDEAAKAQALQAKAEAIKSLRKRKFEARMGVHPSAGAPPAIAAASSDAMCHSCQAAATKYRCPKCDVGSCSLACVNAHKQKTSCTGVRSRSSYLPVSMMDDNSLQSDLAFLTDVERLSGASKRDPAMQDKKGDLIILPVNQPPAHTRTAPAAATASSLEPSSASLFSCTPRHLEAASYTLMTACTHHRNIKFMAMPHGMKMHKENASRVYARSAATSAVATSAASLTPSQSVIRWTVHLVFKHRALTAQGPHSDLKIVKKRVDERCTWAQLLDAVLQPAAAPTAPAAAAADEEGERAGKKSSKAVPVEPKVSSISTALLRHQLAAFYPEAAASDDATSSSPAPSSSPSSPSSASPYDHLRVLYPVPFQPANAPRFYSLSLSASLLSSLAFKVLIEHPVVWVVCARDAEQLVIEKEPQAPTKTGPLKPSKEARAALPRKKRRTEGEEGAAQSPLPSDAPLPAAEGVTASASASSPPPPSSADSDTPQGGFNRGGHRGGHRGGGGRGRGGGGGRGRGRGRGGWQGGDRSQAPPAYSFGVTKAPEPAPPPKPATTTPSLFKKWA